jgi:hypothetical protein
VQNWNQEGFSRPVLARELTAVMHDMLKQYNAVMNCPLPH